MEVLCFDNQKDYEEWRRKNDIETAKIMDSVYNYYMNECKTNGSKQIFHDWWKGECVSTDKYRLDFNKQDIEEASDCILEATSRGFG